MQKGHSGIDVKAWRLDAGGRTAAFASFDGSAPALVHFGAALPDTEDLAALALMTLPNIAGGQLDPLVPLTLLPCAMDGWQGHPGIILQDETGQAVLPAPRLGDASAARDKADFSVICEAGTLRADLHALLEENGVLTLSGSVTPADGHRVSWFALAVPVADRLSRILDHGGRWTGEFHRQERGFTTGQHVRESREGRTGHAHYPGAFFLCDSTGETDGPCLAASLAWSGGHRLIAEQIPDGRRQVQIGMQNDSTISHRIDLPPLHLVWSYEGMNGASQGFHALSRRFARTKHQRMGKTARPVHYNCWEAVYFRHSMDELKEIAERAAALGAERFVLDDGWFKGRNDDTSSLGDWVIDRIKFPDGLTPLIDHVQSLGMRFGIWFEPEMINRNSDLARAHPDWILGPLNQPSGRYQHVLDLSNPAVADNLFRQIADILSAHAIDYIKWDHNRILTGGGPEQTHALNALLDRLEDAFPGVEIESCSSGGGRIDLGILTRTTRVWLSDSNDAVERLRMQFEASRHIAPEIMGSHVGPRTCHTSGRILPMAFRAWVAASRHMGFEMDPRELTSEEAATLTGVTRWYRDNRNFLFSARHDRLESHDAEVFAEQFSAADRSRFVLFRGQTGACAQIASRPLALTNLDAATLYNVRLINPETLPRVLNQNMASAFGRGEPVTLSGAALMGGGLRLPNAFPATMMVVEGDAA